MLTERHVYWLLLEARRCHTDPDASADERERAWERIKAFSRVLDRRPRAGRAYPNQARLHGDPPGLARLADAELREGLPDARQPRGPAPHEALRTSVSEAWGAAAGAVLPPGWNATLRGFYQRGLTTESGRAFIAPALEQPEPWAAWCAACEAHLAAVAAPAS
jgi:hypothetical protein